MVITKGYCNNVLVSLLKHHLTCIRRMRCGKWSRSTKKLGCTRMDRKVKVPHSAAASQKRKRTPEVTSPRRWQFNINSCSRLMHFLQDVHTKDNRYDAALTMSATKWTWNPWSLVYKRASPALRDPALHGRHRWGIQGLPGEAGPGSGWEPALWCSAMSKEQQGS